MSIASTDIHYRLSGGATNIDPTQALGGVKSSNDADGLIFNSVASVDAGTGMIDYRCVYVQNMNATLTLSAATVSIPSNTPSPTTTIDIGVGASALNGIEQSIPNARTAPAGVAFGQTAVLGDIPPGQSRALWLRRTIGAGTVAIADTFTIRVTGDTQ